MIIKLALEVDCVCARSCAVVTGGLPAPDWIVAHQSASNLTNGYFTTVCNANHLALSQYQRHNAKRGLAARARVLDAYTSGRDWALVADCNCISATTGTCTARKIVERGPPDVKTRGGARAACTKRTPEMEEALYVL
ncbi:uncharacterized protein PITG_08689 [Phytophthora infestans T30-4]|uniref:Uncharacterized protein n=1 Tax=Phytophthora infestans (strain T30-4) TaxID=403677 RepID=D0NCY6_PHYIT|nr:uncharacterized protein PITG_08689 [Phytophthora infestans T30-4]EEY55943.1 hypothetical protein PITG_08689 [Phytophthora infestans T30-4]|eukprot:XP_002902773.1 hypothetical protein PITG_08689 [Phytophthora infestans T30-4]